MCPFRMSSGRFVASTIIRHEHVVVESRVPGRAAGGRYWSAVSQARGYSEQTPSHRISSHNPLFVPA